MSNELKIFKNEEFGEVRSLIINNETYFVGKDIAEILGYSNSSKAVSTHVDEEDRTLKMMAHSQNGNMIKTQTSLINESGLYSLILKSKLPNAKKFKRWVTSEVLPSIRKHGAYMTENTLEKAITSPDFLIRLATELKNEQEQRRELETKIETDKPFTLLGNAVSSSQGSILVRELSKILNQNGVDTGEKRLYSWLRDNGFIIKKKGDDYNLPTQKSMNLGLMEIKETVVNKWNGSEIKSTTKITGKGQEYFINKFLHINNDSKVI